MPSKKETDWTAPVRNNRAKYGPVAEFGLAPGWRPGDARSSRARSTNGVGSLTGKAPRCERERCGFKSRPSPQI